MSGWLSMNVAGVKQQANAFHADHQTLSDIADSWGNMLDPTDLGMDAAYKDIATALVSGFDHVTKVVKNWAAAAETFGAALDHSADSVQCTDDQSANDIKAVGFNDGGNLTIGGN